MQSAITVFAQFLSLVPKSVFTKLSKLHKPKRSPRTFSPWSHFVHLLHAQLAGCKSLRDGIMGMNAASNRLYHLGVKPVPRSTFADANAKRPYTMFEALFGELYTRCLSQAPKHKFSFENKLFSLDASVIDLCLTLFPWAKFRTAKGGIKMHTVIDHDGYLPAVVTVTEAKCHEVNIAKLLKLPKGSIVVFDRGYNDYTWFRQLCKSDVFLVTRLKSNARFRVIERHRTDQATGVTSDHIIQVAVGEKTMTLRRVGYRDQETGNRLDFLTNHMTLPARTIADIYKERWQVEIFFRFIKQNLKIKSFLGNSKNAVLSQVYVALIAYLLLAYQKFMSKIGLSLHYLARLVQRNLFQCCNILDLVEPQRKRVKPYDPRQLSLLP